MNTIHPVFTRFLKALIIHRVISCPPMKALLESQPMRQGSVATLSDRACPPLTDVQFTTTDLTLAIVIYKTEVKIIMRSERDVKWKTFNSNDTDWVDSIDTSSIIA